MKYQGLKLLHKNVQFNRFGHKSRHHLHKKHSSTFFLKFEKENQLNMLYFELNVIKIKILSDDGYLA